MPTYKIIRFFQNNPDGRQVVRTGLTKEEATAHCNDPETNSATATSAKAVRLTKSKGPWFDGFEKE